MYLKITLLLFYYIKGGFLFVVFIPKSICRKYSKKIFEGTVSTVKLKESIHLDPKQSTAAKV